jgi:ABC-type transporter Mla subunit MlaD
MSQHRKYFALGLFGLLTMVLLVVLLYLFGSAPGLFRSGAARYYKVSFQDAPGLAVGTPVRRSGIRIGEVEEVNLDDETGNVLSRIRIDRKYTLRKYEQATLITGLLSGDAFIDFIPGELEEGKQPDRDPIDPDDVIVGRRAANVNALLNRTQQVLPTTQETLNDIRRSLQRFERMSPLMEDTMREFRDLAKSVRVQVPELRRTNDEIRELAKAVREATPDFQKSANEVRELSRSVREMVPEIRKTNEELRDFFKSARETIPELRETNKEIRELAKEVRNAVPDLRRTEAEVRELAKSARELMPEVKIAVVNWQKLGESLNVIVQNNQDKVNEIIDSANKLMPMVKTATEAFTESINRVGTLLNDENQRNMAKIILQFRDGTRNLDDVSKQVEMLIREGRETLKVFTRSMSQLEESLKEIRTITKPAGEHGPSIFKNLDESSDRLNKTLGDVRELVQAIAHADGSVRRFLADPSLYNHLDDAALGVMKMLPRFDRILKDMEVFADKLARHPEALGIGGVVRPSSGVKEAPTHYPR